MVVILPDVFVVALGEEEFSLKQDRQFAYNVTLRRVHETTVAVEKL
jgi:hypothetical protein